MEQIEKEYRFFVRNGHFQGPPQVKTQCRFCSIIFQEFQALTNVHNALLRTPKNHWLAGPDQRSQEYDVGLTAPT